MSVQVDFYVLRGAAQTDKDLYACRIAGLAHGRGLKVYMQTDDDARAAALDKMLWTFSQNSFVPHALYRGDEIDLARYPVQIGRVGAPDAKFDLLISLMQDAPADHAKFARIAELIINDDDDKKHGRARFRFYREQGATPNTHNIA